MLNNNETEDSKPPGNPEDEFVQAVKEVAIYGKFPQGLTFEGREIVKPQEWNKEFTNFSLTGFEPGGQFRAMTINSWIWGIDERMYTDPRVKDCLDKHFLAIVPCEPTRRELQNHPDYYKDGYSILIYSALQDGNLEDFKKRYVRSAQLYFLMPTEQAQKFIQLAKERVDGADILERFIQKSAPDVMADKAGDQGVYRVKASELIILDEPFQRSLLTNELLQQRSSARNLRLEGSFLQSIGNATAKPYSQPVGFGIPPA